MSIPRDAIEAFFSSYAQTVAEYNAGGTAELWGEPGTIVADGFVGSMATRAEMAEGLERAQPTYRAFGVTGAAFEITDVDDLTGRISMVTVRYEFHGETGAALVDTEYVYLVRADDDGRLRTYLAVSIDEASKLQQLADRTTSGLGEAVKEES